MPEVAKAHQGKVAARGRFHQMVITSPNMPYIPEWPVESSVIETYDDGRWGSHEYSLSPQDLCRGMWHVACIPTCPSPPNLPPVLWEPLAPQTHWSEDSSIGISQLGYINTETVQGLVAAAKAAKRPFEAMRLPDHVLEYVRFLCMILRQVVSRMRNLPAVAGVAIAVAAHVQRICLELAGLKTYLEILVPRMESTKSYATEILPVIGAFVRDATDAQTCTRIGLPIWFLQPLTRKLAVWTVVECSPPPHLLSRRRSVPPILHHAKSVVGVSNLTGNWQHSMLMTVSRHVAGSHLATLSLAEVPQLPCPEPPAKRVCYEHQAGSSSHYKMRSNTDHPQATLPEHQGRKGRKRGKGKHVADPPAAVPLTPDGRDSKSTSSTTPVQPAKTFTPSPFYKVPPVWKAALQAVSPVPQSNLSALYYYPPPFLLDTISTPTSLPFHPGAQAEHVRIDLKAARYIHNLVRIRPFLRMRLLDPSMAPKPLTIAEWRAALWGDYWPKQAPEHSQRAPSEVRRAERKREEYNRVVHLLSRVAQLRSYNPLEVSSFEGQDVKHNTVEDDPHVRSSLLWEAHELNFRAEVMALDTVLVQNNAWLEIHRWQREAMVSAVWGASSIMSVIPRLDDEEDVQFRWGASSDEKTRDTLRSICSIMTRWPDCPQEVAGAAHCGIEDPMFKHLQVQAVQFYVSSFVRTFHRLPIPPIPYIRPEV